jgi:hypothetical protein
MMISFAYPAGPARSMIPEQCNDFLYDVLPLYMRDGRLRAQGTGIILMLHRTVLA